MDRLILWLSKRRLFAAFSVGAYFLVTVLSHGVVNEAFHDVRLKLSSEVYNVCFTVICLVASGLLSWAIFVKLRSGPDRGAKFLYWFVTIALCALAYTTLFVLNSESVHFVQYGILVVPIFALTKRFGTTVLWGTVLGVFDEAYQYFVIYGDHTTHFDFNDVILNLLGSAIGVVLMLVLSSVPSAAKPVRWRCLRAQLRSPTYVATGILLGTCLLAYATGFLRYYPDETVSEHAVVLRRSTPPTAFWEHMDWGKTFHTLRPAEGLILTLILMAFYISMDCRWGEIPPTITSPGAGGVSQARR